ncbi:MAG TPA: DUF86 domain-containing protein [Polyangia bacterium]|nr:DUF86 domain-containing protein [Polyangia bacterium]
MVERDVVLAKVGIIDRCLQRIDDVRGARAATLTPIDIEDITVLNLTRAAQAAMDLASHVVSTEGYGLPTSVSESFTLLVQHGVIPVEVADRLRKMVGFRNIVIHDYQPIEPKIVERIVQTRLDDLRAFAATVAGWSGIA